jgi:FkbM family methyltransferase
MVIYIGGFMFFKKFIKFILEHFGYTLIKNELVAHFNFISACQTAECDLIVDIGANQGDFTSQLLYFMPNKNIMVCEPLPHEHKLLNKKFSNKQNVYLLDRCAISDESKTQIFNIAGNSVSSSLKRATEEHNKSSPKAEVVNQIKVPTITLNEGINNAETCFNKKFRSVAVKLDVQGSEYDILAQSLPHLLQLKVIMVEASVLKLYEDSTDWLKIINLLLKYNFVVWGIFPVYSHQKTGQIPQFDIIFIR